MIFIWVWSLQSWKINYFVLLAHTWLSTWLILVQALCSYLTKHLAHTYTIARVENIQKTTINSTQADINGVHKNRHILLNKFCSRMNISRWNLPICEFNSPPWPPLRPKKNILQYRLYYIQKNRLCNTVSTKQSVN